MLRIKYTNGSRDVDVVSMDEAVEILRADYPEADIGHDGDLSDGGDRTLVWADSDAACNDSGAHAVAKIVRA